MIPFSSSHLSSSSRVRFFFSLYLSPYLPHSVRVILALHQTSAIHRCPLKPSFVVSRDRIHLASRFSSCVKISVFQCKMRLPGINFAVFKHSKSRVWESIMRREMQHKKEGKYQNFRYVPQMNRKKDLNKRNWIGRGGSVCAAFP
jgi:hypothetical protein